MAMEHVVNLYVRSFTSSQLWVASSYESGNFLMIKNEERWPTSGHRRGYNGLTAAEVSSSTLNTESGIVSRWDLVPRWRGDWDSNVNEVLDTVSVTHSSYDSLSYVPTPTFVEDGWRMPLTESQHPKLPWSTSWIITPTMIYSRHLFNRWDDFNVLQWGGRLF